MKDIEREDWDPKASPLLAAERRNVSAPGAAEDRVWGKLAVLGPPGPGGSGSDGTPRGAPPGNAAPARSSLRSAFRLGSWPMTIGVYALGIFTGLAGATALRPRRSTPEARANPAPAVVTVPPPVVSSAPPPPVPEVAPSVPPAPAPSSKASPSDHSLEDERALLDRARAALGRGDGAAALAETTVHARRYGDGILAEEREAIAIQALLLLQRYDDARQREAAFERHFPRSPLLQSVRASVQSIP